MGFKTGHELREAEQTKRIAKQRSASRRRLSAGGRPVSPLPQHGDCASLGVQKAQRVLAGKPPGLQNPKRLSA
jgi:hypothetical protein